MLEYVGLVLIGVMVGLVVGLVVREKSLGHVGNLAVATIGSIAGGFLFGLLSLQLRGPIGTLLAGVFGAFAVMAMVVWIKSWPTP